MKTNSILKQIREIRDQLYDEADGDLKKLYEMARQKEAAAGRCGAVIIAVPERTAVVREEPSHYGVKPAKPKMDH